MHQVFFYRDRNGREPVVEYMAELASKKDKDRRIKLDKINDLEGNIWELRPLRDRILFVGWINGNYVLLHHFMKKTQKTPTREIEKAKREFADLIERGVSYES